MQLKEIDLLIAIISVSIFVVSILIFFFIVIYINYKQNLRKNQEAINLIYKTEEKERKRIAIELHDNIGAYLSIIKLHASSVSINSNINTAVIASENIILNANETLHNLRSLVRNLVPNRLEENGWSKELQELIQSINNSQNELVTLNVSEFIPRFNIDSEIILYRIVQEIINNALKHSNASSIIVKIESIDSKILISIEDNGIGFKDLKSNSGNGLKNILTRVDSLKGKIDFGNNSNGGVFFKISFNTSNLQ